MCLIGSPIDSGSRHQSGSARHVARLLEARACYRFLSLRRLLGSLDGLGYEVGGCKVALDQLQGRFWDREKVGFGGCK